MMPAYLSRSTGGTAIAHTSDLASEKQNYTNWLRLCFGDLDANNIFHLSITNEESGMKKSDPAFGTRLRKIRETHEMSQSDFGKLFARSKQCISSWESGRAEMHAGQLLLLSRVFPCDLHWLLTGQVRHTDGGEAKH